MNPPTHQLAQLLFKLGLSTSQDLEIYHQGTRDRAEVSVFRCKRSEVVLLSTIEHINIAHYELKNEFVFGRKDSRAAAIAASIEDSERRAAELRPVVANKRWLDVGTGHGGILDLVAPCALETVAVEPQKSAREALSNKGYCVLADISLVQGKFDVITLYHVFEHLIQPLEFLIALKPLLNAGGRIIVEVPHARDALLSLYGDDRFRRFTLWSEHLILHTRQSLGAFARAAGFTSCEVLGVQRYPLANHLFWLSKGQPGGHMKWSFLRQGDIDAAYGARLAAIDRTDTLTAIMSP